LRLALERLAAPKADPSWRAVETTTTGHVIMLDEPE
jgi:hypothetical protein